MYTPRGLISRETLWYNLCILVWVLPSARNPPPMPASLLTAFQIQLARIALALAPRQPHAPGERKPSADEAPHE